MNYKKLNVYLGWLVFIVAAFVYLSTAEWTASLWDCGEFIATAYKLEVGHPPGAPFFMLMGRLFSLFAGGNTAEVAHWINRMSALCSAFTILFLFWSITMLGRKIAEKDGAIMTKGQMIAILGSGLVGALAYTFTDSFWFSAVEGEVYAMSSLFTALIFWAALRWDRELIERKNGELPTSTNPLRWMVLIMFLIGLAIGVHLLGLLVVPAIAYLVAHQVKEKLTLKTFIITGVIGLAVLVFIQNGVIPKTIKIASSFEVFFVNSIGVPIGTGAAIFFILLVALLIAGLIFTRKKGYVIGNTVFLGLIVLYIGYGSFATLVIRSNANTPLDENNPENLVTLESYLNREQYGTWPISYGPYFNSKPNPVSEYGNNSPVHDSRWVVSTPEGIVVSTFKKKDDALKYIKKSGKNYSMDQKYYVTNKEYIEHRVPTYAQNTVFPRMFDRSNPSKIRAYKEWSGYNPNRQVPPALIGSDGHPIPTFANNMQYFVNYQVGWMYWRYFMWNFTGRQNDMQGYGDKLRGQWISGVSWVDSNRLGAQGENAPYFTTHNPNHVKFFFIPLILGLIGLFFQFLKAPKDALVVTILFLMTGLAIIIYLNQKPIEPRERDYAYAGSFYAFAIWVGLGVYGLYEAFRSFKLEEYKKLLICYVGLLFIGLIVDLTSQGEFLGGTTRSLLVIGLIGGAGYALMSLLRKINFSHVGAAGLATILGLVAPFLMGTQGWKGHDRSHRTSTRALAYNYLVGCSPNAILFTNGDNDTFPLWYIQEVEGFRTDVRVDNLSLMQTDWYTDQMKMRAYKSAPLPIKFREDQILMGEGGTDVVPFVNFATYKDRIGSTKATEIIKKKIESNPVRFERAFTGFRSGLKQVTLAMTANSPAENELLAKIIAALSEPIQTPGYNDYKRINLIVQRIFKDLNAGKISINQNLSKQLQDAANSWTKSWDYLPIQYAMAFVRNDANKVEFRRGSTFRFFPSSGFIIPVNVENAVKAGIISKDYAGKALKELRIQFDENGLSRENVMMLDILANFDWKRGIYFSSPGASEVAKTLYYAGYLQNYGQTFGLTPLQPAAARDYSRDIMYDNIVHKYSYGNLNADGVLVDYYTRRQTSQFRNNFLSLAMEYMRDYQTAVARPVIDSTGTTQVKDSTYYSNRIDTILEYSLKMLPIDKVFPNDPRSPQPSQKKLSNGDPVYSDGSMPGYIRLLYTIGKTKRANELAINYLDQLKTMMNYFQHSDPLIAYHNKDYFISSTMNFLRVYAQILISAPDSKAATYAQQLDDKLTNKVVAGIVNGLKEKTTVETVGRDLTRMRSMEKEANDFAELYSAMLQETGFQTDKGKQTTGSIPGK